MTPRFNNYVIYGALLDYRKFTPEQDALMVEYSTKKNGLIILDSPYSEYVIVGALLAKTENDGIFKPIIEIKNLPVDYDRAALLELINDLGYDATEVGYEWIIVSHPK